MSDGLERALIFGCGAAGRAALPHLAATAQVVGFVDNDPALHDATVLGHPVFAPGDLSTLEFDRVYVASVAHDAIRRQLITQLGVAEARVTVVTGHDDRPGDPTCSPSAGNRLERYLSEGFHRIGGWLYLPAVEATLLLAGIQAGRMIPGPVCEIGVWEGRYLTLLSFVPSAPRPVLGIDPFVHAAGTADASAEARRAQIRRVRANVARYARRPALVSLLQRDSKTVSTGDVLERLGGEAQFVSVDGDHSVEGCLHDLQLAEAILAHGGIVAVDDIPNMTCPGVIEAVMRHCLSPGAALGPFLSVANKLFLTQRELCDGYREAVLQCAREGRAGAWGASMLAYRERMQAMRVPVRFLGQDLLVCP